MYPSTATGYMNILSYSIGLNYEDWNSLKERGIHVIEPIRRGWTVLYTAAVHGCFDVCKEIIDDNPPMDYMNSWTRQGKYSNDCGCRHNGDGVYEWMVPSYDVSYEYERITPLTAASEFGHIDICRLLIDYHLQRFNVLKRIKLRERIKYYENDNSEQWQKNILKSLYEDLNDSQRVDSSGRGRECNHIWSNFESSLYYAVKDGHDDVGVLLCKHMKLHPGLFIRHACIHGCIQTFSFLYERYNGEPIDRCRYTDTFRKNEFIRELLYVAVESDQTDMCRFIISLGVDFGLEEALEISIRNKHKDVCTLLTRATCEKKNVFSDVAQETSTSSHDDWRESNVKTY